MGSHHFEVVIGRAPDTVWRYLADPSHELEWQQGVVSSVHVPAGPVAVGTRKTKVRRTPMAEQRFVVEYTRVDEAAREWDDLVVEGSVAGSTGRYRVSPDGLGSRVVLDVRMTARGIARLLMPVIDSTTRRDLKGGFERLKEVLEAAPAEPVETTFTGSSNDQVGW